jgi:hypothetical protein
VIQRDDNGFHLKDGVEMINDEEFEKEMKFEKLCGSGNCNSMPAKQKMQIKVCSILQNDDLYSIFYENLFSSTDSL